MKGSSKDLKKTNQLIETVEIPENLYKTIKNAAIITLTERCGILVGYKIKDKYTITHIIEDMNPENQSFAGVTRVTRNIWNRLNEIARDFYPSDYIGEWHTHPAGFLDPSILDIITMNMILKSRDYNCLGSTVLIIADSTKNIGCWVFQEERQLAKVKLKIIENTNLNSKNILLHSSSDKYNQ